MDFKIDNQREFDLRLEGFLDDLKKRDYSESTLKDMLPSTSNG